MSDAEQNRSLDRGLTVLECLSRFGPRTLSEVARDADLPITTTRRLLTTLVERNFVRRSMADGRYRVNIMSRTALVDALSLEDQRFVDQLMVRLAALTRRIKWPCDLHVMDDLCMRFVDTTRPLSPHFMVPGVVDRRFNVFGAASGQACLALCPPSMVEHLIERTRGDAVFGLERFNMTKARLYDEIEATRARGYGKRLYPYLGETVAADNLSAVAVAVRSPNGTLFGIPLVFTGGLMSPEAFAEAHVEALRQAAQG